MKRKAFLWSVVLVCIIVSLAAGAKPAAADALTASIANLTCTSVTVSGLTSSFGGPGNLTIDLQNLNSGNGNSIGFFQGPIGISQTFSHTFSINAAPGDIIQALVSDQTGNSSSPQATVAPGCAAVGSSGGSGGFNPGDGRIDPRPWDRIIPYCNTSTTGFWANTVAFYGVLDDSTGVFLTQIKYADLVAAGGKGITRSVEPNGTVVVWVNNKTQFYVKWYGGPADATGVGDFRKRFSCTFKS